MRTRRLEAKAASIARQFLADQITAAEACFRFSQYLSLLPAYFSPVDRTFITAVNSETDDIPMTPEVRELWHQDVLQEKLIALRRYESTIASEVAGVCTRLLQRIQEIRRKVDNV